MFSPAVFQGQELKRLIWSALDDTCKWHKRHCVLQAPLVFCGVIAMTVFRPLSIINAFKHVFDAARGLENVPLKGVTDEAIYHARGRLGVSPLRAVARALGSQNDSQPSFLGFIPLALDGVKLTVPDTPENEAVFGRPAASRGNTAFPQIGGAALLHVDTRKIIDCVWGKYNLSELSMDGLCGAVRLDYLLTKLAIRKGRRLRMGAALPGSTAAIQGGGLVAAVNLCRPACASRSRKVSSANVESSSWSWR